MKFYKVTNGIYDDGYYQSKLKAIKRAHELNELIEEKKNIKNINKDKYFVRNIKTKD